MNTRDQQLAIATACGWRDITVNPFAPNPPFCGFNDAQGKTEFFGRFGIPDFINSLDAMQEAEKILTNAQMTTYDSWLPLHRWLLIRATPMQRAEAFLRTLNLWNE